MKQVLRSLIATMMLTIPAAVSAQQFPGYTLYSTSNSTTARLIDTAGTVYHTWSGLTGQTGYSSYLLPDGVLLRTVKVTNSTFTGGGMHGRVQKVDWSGTLLWDYTYSTSTYCAHHDVCALPNGNVLIIAYELKNSAAVTQAGCSQAITMWPDKLIEVQPTGATTGTIVWEWNLWDHLCQSVDANKDNYVTSTAAHPELWDINANITKEIWHMNGVDYNPMLDQIVLSAHNTDEYYVIDHSTTTAEAASHSGGRSGHGGDFLYRWGNPSNYGQTGTTNFNVLHDAHWIPEGCPNAGQLVALNNKGISQTQSCVDMTQPPLSGFNYTYTANTAWAPATYTQRLTCTGGTTNMGNSNQLPNGNHLVCLALSGTIYETNPAGTTIWSFTASGSVPQAHRYATCYVNAPAPATPMVTVSGNTLTADPATTYQWYLNGVQIAGATSQTYTATVSGTYQVRTTDANGCSYAYSALLDLSVPTGLVALPANDDFGIFPNPAGNVLYLIGTATGNEFGIQLLNMAGQVVLTQSNTREINLSELPEGMYIVQVRTESNAIITRRLVIAR
jgi:hypothetical protein